MNDKKYQEMLDSIKAKVIDVKLDPSKKRGVVSVEISNGDDKWHKPFGISLEQGKIKWSDFTEQLKKEVLKDLEKDTALSEISNMVDKEFNLFEKKGKK